MYDINGTVLQVFVLVCSLGMEPLATLHHFVHPQWFEKLGAFEREENIALFLAWTRLAFQCAHNPSDSGGIKGCPMNVHDVPCDFQLLWTHCLLTHMSGLLQGTLS